MLNIVRRAGFACVGAFGAISIIPNVMLGSAPNSELKGQVGITASYTLIGAGILGVVHHANYLPINCAIIMGLAGIGLQCLAFALHRK